MKLSPITRDDLPECAALFVDVFNGEPWNESWSIEPVVARFNECFSTPGFSGLIGRDGGVISFALGYVETWDSSKHYFLKEMCVTPDRQRSGIGSELITELEKDLIQKGIQKIYLLTSRDGSAESFYRRNSFYVSRKMIMMGKFLTSEDTDGTTSRRRQSREAAASQDAYARRSAREMEIRRIAPDELPQLLELYRHLHSADDPLPEIEKVQSVWNHICQDPALQYFGAFGGEMMISSCTLTVIPNLTRGCRPYGLIENVVTNREYRRQGYGRSILEFALERAWEQNCYKVMLLTGRMDQAIMRFYEGAGFDPGSKQAFIAKPRQNKSAHATARG